MKYPNVLRAVTETPWAVRLETLEVIREVVALRAAGDKFTAEEIQARVGAPGRRQGVTAGSVAVIPVFGVITPRAGLMTQMSGGTSAEQLMNEVRSAAQDDSVDAILLNVDSPGGMTDLVPELAAELRAARDEKPVVAVANTDAFSAAYWLAAQASELVVTPSGSVGSIGVYAAHEDVSGEMDRLGRRTTLISAGRFKTEGNPFEPLSEEAQAAMQARVDAFYGMFVRDVALGRGVSEDTVTGGFGEGRIVTAEDALRAGMVDRVATFDETLARLVRGSAPRGRGVSASVVSVPVVGASSPAPAVEFSGGGLTLTEQAEGLAETARHIAGRFTSLAEVQRGRLTAAKRQALSACTEELRAFVGAMDELLTDTDQQTPPPDHANAAIRERARFERGRANL